MSGFGGPPIFDESFVFLHKLDETAGSGLYVSYRGGSLSDIDLTSEEKAEERVLSNGDIYVGSLVGSVPVGFGKYLWPDGCMYEGQWVEGKKSGNGKISWPSGATYEGDFMAGYIHGVGTFTAVNSSTYKGGWYMDEKKGFGTKNYPNGDVYEGSWNQGLPDGYGQYVWKNGNEYVGDWKSGAMCGRGVLTWVRGDKYDGQWSEGLEHGHGTYTWADGSRYVGTWTRGLKDGKGTFFPPKRSFSQGYLSNIAECEGLGDDECTSPRPQSPYASDSELLAERVCRVSSYGSSVDKLTCSETSTGSDNGVESSPQSSVDDDCNRAIMREHDADVLKQDSVDDDSNRAITSEHDADVLKQDSVSEQYHLVDQAAFMSCVVEREYVQGVLINELVKENKQVQGAKLLRRWHRRLSREPVRPGEAIFKGHQSYDLMVNLQLGIRYTVGKITPEPMREIGPADFGPRARIWMNFPREGSQLTPPHESVDFKWKDYCPMVFRHLRELFEIDSADYMLSICGNSALRELSSPGKSGSVFYLSNDDRFMIKTMRKAEVKALLGMLSNYYDHVRLFENTLIAKFFGLHRIKPAGGQKVHFIVMGNVFCTELRIQRKFDLKGSSQGRSAEKLTMDENTTLKDLDLDFIFRLEPSWRQALLRQIECDCKFLENERIMDYSLLLGLHFRAPQFPAVFSLGPSRPPLHTHAKGSFAGDQASEASAAKGLFLVTHEPEKNPTLSGPHIRGSPLKTAENDNEEVDLLLPGTARLRIQMGVNMPARADRRQPVCRKTKEQQHHNGEAYDVVLFFGIIDILQEYDMGKRLEHAYKSLHFDAHAISAVDPSVYSKRFQDFIRQIFPDNRD